MSRLDLKRAMAWGCAALVFAVTSLSAFVRFARAGGGVAASAIEVARGVHRVSASAALLLAIVLLVQCYMRSPPLRRPGRLAAAVVAAGLALAVLGRFAGDSLAPPVVLANLFGGFAMFTLACALAMALGPAAAVPREAPSRGAPSPCEALVDTVVSAAGALPFASRYSIVAP